MPAPTSIAPAAPTGYTRRQAFKLGASAAGILGAIGVVGVVGPVDDAAAQRQTAAPLVIPPNLPRLFGSPTDLAINRPDHAWALETDGAVHRFDPEQRIWKRSDVRWEDVLASGTAYLAQWGRPTGLHRLVLVFGSTEPPPTTTTATTPTTTSTTSSTPPPSGGDSSSTPSSAASTTTVPTTRTTSGYPGYAGGAGDSGAGSPLAYTGFDAIRMLVAAIGALIAGTVLTLWARRNAVASGPPPEEPDAPTPPTTANPPPHR
jgi:hypothetical protein